MNKLDKLLSIKSILKIQEQKIILEFNELKNQYEAINQQIVELNKYCGSGLDQFIDKNIKSEELSLMNRFFNKAEFTLNALNKNKASISKNYLLVEEKLLETQRTLISVSKLIKTTRAKQEAAASKAEQTSLEEHLRNQFKGTYI